MIGVLANCATVAIGCIIGLFFKKGIPERISDALMKCIGLITAYIGLTGIFDDGANTLVIILSMVVGAVIGELIDIDKWLARLGDAVEAKFKKESKVSLAEGFVTSSLLFCVGAMTVVGSLQAGLLGDNTTLFTKALLDGIAAAVFASTLGIGVMFSVFSVFVLQGGIVLLSKWIAPFLTDAVVANMTIVGSLLIFALSLNLIKVAKIKVANLMPAVFLPLALCPLYEWLTSLF